MFGEEGFMNLAFLFLGGGGAHDKDYPILGSILGHPDFLKQGAADDMLGHR